MPPKKSFTTYLQQLQELGFPNINPGDQFIEFDGSKLTIGLTSDNSKDILGLDE